MRLEHLEPSTVGLALGMTRGEAGATEAGSHLTVLGQLHLSHPQSGASFLGVLLSRDKFFLCYVNGEGETEVWRGHWKFVVSAMLSLMIHTYKKQMLCKMLSQFLILQNS